VDSLIPILIIGVLLVLNALFVAAEFAIVGAPRAAIERRAAAGQRVARTVQQTLEDPRRQDRFIATAQLGITIASLGLGMYGEHVLAEWLAQAFDVLGASRFIAAHTVASVTAVALLTYFHIVLGEMIPKSLALQSAERTVLWITPIMSATTMAAFPFIVALNALGNGLLRLVGVDRREGAGDHLYSPEELALVVEESQAGGLLRRDAGQMIRELFAFGDTMAREAMVPRVQVGGIALGSDPEALRARVAAVPHTRYPVFDGDLDHIVGQVHIKELLEIVEGGASVTLGNVRPIPFIPETTPLDAVLGTLRRQASQMAVVFDEHGGTAGIITLEDLFDEVTGEIQDEPAEPQSIVGDASGRVRVAGTVRIEQVGEALGVVLEHPDVDSVSGLVLTLLGRPPAIGDVVEYDHVRFEVTAVHRRGVRECVVSHVSTDESALTDH
jgi:CBS domain containing-hemolysin-like protein